MYEGGGFWGGGTPILPFFVRRVPTLPGKPWKKWNFVIFFSKPGKCLEFPQKVVKTGNFNLKPGKNVKFANSMFQASLFKMSFTKIILICFFVISTLSTQTLIRSQIDPGFYCFYLEITWKIHEILCHKRSGNPGESIPRFYHSLGALIFVRGDNEKIYILISMDVIIFLSWDLVDLFVCLFRSGFLNYYFLQTSTPIECDGLSIWILLVDVWTWGGLRVLFTYCAFTHTVYWQV